MGIVLTPTGRTWIDKQLTESGAGTVPELIAAFIASSPVSLTKEDIQVDLSAIETEIIDASLKALAVNRLIVERV